MKQLTCEMCGGTDLVKQDGVFVCQNCGCKYSIEEAKKMMVEGTVDVQGTVKVDKSEEVQNLYVLARRAKNSDDFDNAHKYYELIMMKDPNGWEAYFYSVYYDAMTCKIRDIDTAAKKVKMLIKPTFELVREQITDTKEQAKIVCEIGEKSRYLSALLLDASFSHFKERGEPMTGQGGMELIARAILADSIKKEVLEQIPIVFAGNDDVISTAGVAAWKNWIKGGDPDLPVIADMISKIHKYEPDFVLPKPDPKPEPQVQTESSRSGGCYVATAVYGSYDCPQVWTLRRYRDYTLAETWHGRAFIKTYYAISPTLVKWFGHTEWFKKMWQGTLDYMVAKLQANGVESTPYQDKNW